MRIIPDQLNEFERGQLGQGYGVIVERWCLIFETNQEAEEYKEILEDLRKKYEERLDG